MSRSAFRFKPVQEAFKPISPPSTVQIKATPHNGKQLRSWHNPQQSTLEWCTGRFPEPGQWRELTGAHSSHDSKGMARQFVQQFACKSVQEGR